MNEVEFVSTVRHCRTGDIATCNGPHGTVRAIVVSFVDPAKPLLLWSPSPSTAVIEFFQDALYAAEPWIPAERVAVHRLVDGARIAWTEVVTRIIGMPFDTDSDRFEAYAAGLFGVAHEVDPDEHTRITSAAESLDRRRAGAVSPREDESPWITVLPESAVWEGHRRYAFR
ncbi:MAG: hypothetical protein ACOCYB_09860 [Alkalispirochaeta sp.]